MVWLLVLALIFALLVAVFALQNAAVIGVQFFVWRVEVSLVLVVLVSATVGAVIVGLAALLQRVRLYRQVKHLEGRIRELERSLTVTAAGAPARGAPAPTGPPEPRAAGEGGSDRGEVS